MKSCDDAFAMWQEFWKYIFRDPFIWIAAVAGVVFLVAWRSEIKRTRYFRNFARSRGYHFTKTTDPDNLKLRTTSFFRKHDRIKNIVVGTLSSKSFVYFEHHARRGKYISFAQSIASFTVPAAVVFRPTTLGSFDLGIEKSGEHVFVWRDKHLFSPNEFDRFMQLAMMAYLSATS